MLRMPSRRAVLAAGSAFALAPSLASGQGTWPTKPVRVVVGLAPGGLTDGYARAYSEYIAQKIGQPMVVENKPGAGSIIACEQVAKAAPDGYTFLFTIATALQQNQVLYKKLPYNPDKDFTFISAFGAGHLPMAVHKDVPAKTVAEFVDFAKKNPTTLGTYAPGSYPHMIAQQLNKLYGTKIEAVHYRGEAPMWQDLGSGQIHAAVGSVQAVTPHVQAGNARVIAVPTKIRSPRFPDVPTFVEQGFKESVFVIQGWIGMLGPAGVPKEIVDRLSVLIAEAAETPKIKQLHETFAIADRPTSPAEFERLYREDGKEWIALARELGVTLD